jgi:hypothetical protein
MQHSRIALRQVFAAPHSGLVELAGVVVLYALYEVLRGFGDLDFATARRNTASIVELERSLNIFTELEIQRWAHAVPGLAGLLGFAYLASHILVTGAVLVWVYRSHRARFALLRTTLVVSTAIALVGYVLYPAAPPRLSGLGFADTVTEHAHVNLSSDFLGSFYNPIAAVPSLHFGYAFIVGVAVAALARHPVVRAIGAAYPALMLFIIVATGNHFLFDAFAGGVVAIGGWLIAKVLVADVRRRPRERRAALLAA